MEWIKKEIFTSTSLFFVEQKFSITHRCPTKIFGMTDLSDQVLFCIDYYFVNYKNQGDSGESTGSTSERELKFHIVSLCDNESPPLTTLIL